MSTATLGVIPARWGSRRFPGKPLAKILGKPMIQWVYQAAKRALPRVVVATDDQRIAQAVRDFGGEVLMTSRRCQSGTDRVAEAARKISARIYINIQGDEPTMMPSTIQSVVKAMRDPKADMATAAAQIARSNGMDSAHLAVSPQGFALYFSRFPIPCGGNPPQSPFVKGGGSLLKHIGIYAYRKVALLKLSRLPRSPLERLENLEQIRALENGFHIKVVKVRSPTLGVDRPGDIRRAERYLKKRN